MTDTSLRALVRLLVTVLATAKLAEWIGPALPFEGWGWAIVMTACVMGAGLLLFGAIGEPPYDDECECDEDTCRES
jgi:hypothetical protein